jgi:hypothetical protein
VWKLGSAPESKGSVINAPLGLVEKIQPLPSVLQAPEEQTDNWDDDFEEGIPFSKLQGRSHLSRAIIT